MPRTLLALFGATFLALLNGTVHAQPPSITGTTPYAVRVGQTTEVTLTGENLVGPLQLVTSFPAQIEIVSQEAQRVVCRMTVPADAPSQVGALLACKPEGATDAMWMIVDDVPTVADQGTNHQLAAAQDIPFGSGVDGTADGTEADYYRVSLAANQRLAVEVLAARWGSTCDPVVRLLTPEGQEILAVDDIEGLGGDCHFEYVAKQDGPLVIELRDNKYQSAVRYRLRIGDLPLTQVCIPLGVQRGTIAEVVSPTAHPEVSFRSIVAAPHARWISRAPWNARTAATASASVGSLVVSDLAEYRESEPNQDVATATALAVPSGVTGVISDPADRDVYSFPARAGQRLVFRTTARSVGSPAFPLLRILDSAGQQLAESSYGDADEVSLPFTAPAEGLYQLQVDELTQRGGPQYVYRIEISDAPFRLALKNVPEAQFRLAAPTGDGAAFVDLQCERLGYDGPIALSVDPSVAGIELFQPIIPASAAEHRLYLAFNEKMPVGALQTLRIVGRPVGSEEHQVSASTTFQLRTRWPAMTPLSGWHDGLFVVSATPAAAPILKASTDASALFVPRGNGTAQFVITAERLNAEFKDPLAAISPVLPEGVTAAVTPEGDKFTITLTNAGHTQAGTHSLVFGFFGAFSGRAQLARVQIPLEINDPLSLTTSTLQIKPATVEKLKVQLVRRGAERQAVTLTFQNLPAGITIPETTIPAEVDSVDLDVTAAAEAAPGTYEVTQMVASQYAGQPTNATAKLTITVPAP